MTALKDLKSQLMSGDATAFSRQDSLVYDESIEGMSAEELLAELTHDGNLADDESEINENAAEQVRHDVQLLLQDAPRTELDLVRGIDAVLVEGAVEAISNVFRMAFRQSLDAVLAWTIEERVLAAGRLLFDSIDLHLATARYLGLWENESDTPAETVRRMVSWTRRAAVRVPELFRHARVIDITAQSLVLGPQERALWLKSRCDRWSIRSSVRP